MLKEDIISEQQRKAAEDISNGKPKKRNAAIVRSMSAGNRKQKLMRAAAIAAYKAAYASYSAGGIPPKYKKKGK